MARLPNSRAFTAALLLASLGALSPAPVDADTVTLIAPSDSGIYSEFRQSFQRSLTALCGSRQHLEICQTDKPVTFATPGDAAHSSATRNGELVVPLGTRAAEFVASQPDLGPTLFALIPADTFQYLRDCCIGQEERLASAVFVDQPIEQQLKLARALLPKARRLGVLLGPTSLQRAAEIRESAERFGFDIRMETVADEQAIGIALRRIAVEVDALLAVPDPLVFNRATIANILLASYRHELPVIGYSEGLVRAGATAAVFADIGQLAETVARKTLAYYESRVLEPSCFALDFSVSLNREVLRSLGLQAPSEPALKETLAEEQR